MFEAQTERTIISPVVPVAQSQFRRYTYIFHTRWLCLLMLVIATNGYAVDCGPVSGYYPGYNDIPRAYSSCGTAGYSSAAVVFLSVMGTEPPSVSIGTGDPSQLVPPVTVRYSLGAWSYPYYVQDMGSNYVGDCLDLAFNSATLLGGPIGAKQTAIAGHYYCSATITVEAPTAGRSLYLGALLTDTGTFINPVASIYGPVPTAVAVNANDVKRANAGELSYSFTIGYSDEDGNLDTLSIDVNDINVCNGDTCLTVTNAEWSGSAVGGTATYTVTPPGGSWDTADNGSYTISIKANEVADGYLAYAAAADAGSFVVSIAEITVPDAPVIGTATPADTAARIAFTPPANSGGSSILDYTASCGDNFATTGPASPLLVTGLSNGSTYFCSVTARNSKGSSTSSGTVSVTPDNQGNVVLPPSDGGEGEAVTFTYSATQPDGTTPAPVTLSVVATIADLPDPPTEASSLVSAIDISSTSTHNGYILVVTLNLAADTQNEFAGFWKFGKEVLDDTDHWYDYGSLEANGDGRGYEISTDLKSLTVYLIDGQKGDDDWQSNSIIIDPALAIVQKAQGIFKDGFETTK